MCWGRIACYRQRMRLMCARCWLRCVADRGAIPILLRHFVPVVMPSRWHGSGQLSQRQAAIRGRKNRRKDGTFPLPMFVCWGYSVGARVVRSGGGGVEGGPPGGVWSCSSTLWARGEDAGGPPRPPHL